VRGWALRVHTGVFAIRAAHRSDQRGDIMPTNHSKPRGEVVDATALLRAALAREQERSAQWQRRAEALERVARDAFRMASWGGAVRREPGEPPS
jgi:hypothetical protein